MLTHYVVGMLALLRSSLDSSPQCRHTRETEAIEWQLRYIHCEALVCGPQILRNRQIQMKCISLRVVLLCAMALECVVAQTTTTASAGNTTVASSQTTAAPTAGSTTAAATNATSAGNTTAASAGNTTAASAGNTTAASAGNTTAAPTTIATPYKSWNCTLPQSSGTYYRLRDCTMETAGVSLTGNLNVTGRSSLTTITAKTSGDRRHFYVDSGRTLTLKWLKLTGGSVSGNWPNNAGGSIHVSGTGSTLHATSCVFFLNTAGWGGVVYNYQGSTLIQDSIIANNTAVDKGGGIMHVFGTATIIRSLISRNRQTTGTSADYGGGGVFISFNAVLNVRETTIEHNRAGTNRGHQIMAFKWNFQGGAPAVTVVNTRFIPCTACETNGTNFYLHDYDNTGNSGAAAYGTLSRKTCSDSPCTVSPFTGACTDRTDNANHGVLCSYASSTTCPADSYKQVVSVNVLPPSNEPCLPMLQWSCTAPSPETSGAFGLDNDCTMTSAGVYLTGDLNVIGRSSLTTITAKTSGNRRHFYVESGRTLTLKWLNLTGGSMSGSFPNNCGGSIYVDGTGSTLHATSCVFFLNTADSSGGGVISREGGSVQVYHSNITGNTAYVGGGVYNRQGSTVVQDSIIADNTAFDQGGGITQQDGTLTITRSLIRDNRQTRGGDSRGGGQAQYQY